VPEKIVRRRIERTNERIPRSSTRRTGFFRGRVFRCGAARGVRPVARQQQLAQRGAGPGPAAATGVRLGDNEEQPPPPALPPSTPHVLIIVVKLHYYLWTTYDNQFPRIRRFRKYVGRHYCFYHLFRIFSSICRRALWISTSVIRAPNSEKRSF